MTRLPCLVDSPSITQTIDAGGYRADLVLDPDPTNALAIKDGQLFAPSGITDSVRVFKSFQLGHASGAQVVFDQTRWDNTNGRGFTGGFITTTRSGWWLVGGSFGWVTGASNGGLAVQFNASVFGIIAFDSGASFGAFTTTPTTADTISLNPVGMAYLGAGVQIIPTIAHNFGGTINNLASAIPPTPAGVGAEMAGCEMWAVCLKGLVL